MEFEDKDKEKGELNSFPYQWGDGVTIEYGLITDLTQCLITFPEQDIPQKDIKHTKGDSR